MNEVIILTTTILLFLIYFFLNTRVNILTKEVEEFKKQLDELKSVYKHDSNTLITYHSSLENDLDNIFKINANLTKRIIRLEGKLRKTKNGNN